VKAPESNGDEARPPGSIRVAHGVVRLNRGGTEVTASRKRAQQIRRYQRVGVDNNDGVHLGGQTIEGVMQSVALASPLRVDALQHQRTGEARALRGVIRTIVGHHQDVETIRGVVQPQQAAHRFGNTLSFIVRGDDDAETAIAVGGLRHRELARQQRRQGQIAGREQRRCTQQPE